MLALHRPITIAVVVAALAPAGAGAQEFASPDARDRAAAAAPALQDLRSPDARDSAATTAPVPATAPVLQDLRSPDARDSALGLQQAVAATPPATTSSSDTGFDWSDAFIGAGGALALLLLIGGSAFLAVHLWHGHGHGRGGGRPTPA
jgi:hypothetical protein